MSFDHTVHHRNKKTGKIDRITPYSMECHMGQRIYRRDGKVYDGAGKEIEDPKLVGKIADAPFTRSMTVQKSSG